MNRNRARKKISRQIFYFFTYLAKKIFFFAGGIFFTKPSNPDFLRSILSPAPGNRQILAQERQISSVKPDFVFFVALCVELHALISV